jgi:hypothetical protein
MYIMFSGPGCIVPEEPCLASYRQVGEVAVLHGMLDLFSPAPFLTEAERRIELP